MLEDSPPHQSQASLSVSSPPATEVRDNVQSRAQTSGELGQHLRVQYFNTIELVYRTWNFNQRHIAQGSYSSEEKPASTMAAEDQGSEVIHLPEVCLIGNIHNVENTEMRDWQGQSVATYKVIFKCTYDKKCRHLLIKKSDYRNIFVKTFNRMMRVQNQKYLFTHLQPMLLNRSANRGEAFWQLFLLIQPTSEIIHITEQFYNVMFRPIQRILDQEFNYSNLPLTKIYSVDDLDKNYRDGFVFANIKQRFESRQRENITLVGVVSILGEPEFQKNSRNKKQISLLVTQVLFRDYSMFVGSSGPAICREIGRCKLIVRYPVSDAQQIESMFVSNCVYGFVDPEIVFTDSVNIIFLLNIPKGNLSSQFLFRLTSEPYAGIDFGAGSLVSRNSDFRIGEIQDLFGVRLEAVKVVSLLEKSISRNLVRLEVGLLGVEILYGTIKCSRCGIQIRRSQFEHSEEPESQQMKDQIEILEKQCLQSHQELHGLQLWGIVRAADDTGTCLVSMQHKQVMKFLQLDPYYSQLEATVRKNGRGMAIMTSNKEKPKSLEQDPLAKIKARIKKKYVEKSIIGYARTELEKTFREGLTEQQQLDYQGSFQSSKKFVQSRKIFPNGVIEKKFQEILLLPYLKTIEVASQ